MRALGIGSCRDLLHELWAIFARPRFVVLIRVVIEVKRLPCMIGGAENYEVWRRLIDLAGKRELAKRLASALSAIPPPPKVLHTRPMSKSCFDAIGISELRQ